jgi:hypothetical protein
MKAKINKFSSTLYPSEPPASQLEMKSSEKQGHS